jgi:peptidoglycan/xylan/chitin deacetylase (PgdA/CDA1 family)
MFDNEPGALVISLDFELHWGVRDRHSVASARVARMQNVHRVVPRLLDVFTEYGVSATWAAVGFLFARNRADLEAHRPSRLPRYVDARLDPYREPVGEDEQSDPIHYAPSLISRILETQGQEIGTHTYSHYYCLEPGQDVESFRADLRSARAIAATYGVEPHSIAFPRSQHNPAYDPVLLEEGILCYRGCAPGWIYSGRTGYTEPFAARLGRLADAHLPVSPKLTFTWQDLATVAGPVNIPASLFLRPWTPGTRFGAAMRHKRLERLVRGAGARQEVVHLWWHPHNFAQHLDENLDALRRLLDVFDDQRRIHRMRSLTMLQTAEKAFLLNEC